MENDLVDLDELDKLINEIGTKKGKKNTLTGKSRSTGKSSQPRKLNDFDDFNSNDYELPTEKQIDADSKTNKTIKCFPHCYASSDLVGLTKHNKIRFGYYMK